ncbi:hypothetical protein BDZ91DRAFT_710352 [Kalaharituber pfeilii]|nr:hypothetical protein BDZ91DRAFT_710352 [Kalaharituber pfeilii]
MSLLHFYLNGHTSIALIGKSTASIGDPSGRTAEREKSASETITSNFDRIWAQVSLFFDRAEAYALARGYDKKNFGRRELRTNAEWLEGLGLIEFLSGVGRHIRVQQMLARQSVKARMDSQKGINFAEFTYQLLQSYDFWHLYRNAGCRVQIGGNDQYGNITAGIDLIQRLESPSAPSTTPSEPAPIPTTPPTPDLAYGLTVPLLTTPTGEKLGKTSGNALWLDPTLTTPFELYQYLIRLPDAVVPLFLRALTLLPLPDIQATVDRHARDPHLRLAQGTLAAEVVHLVHGPQASKSAALMTRLLFPSADANSASTSTPPPPTAAELLVAFSADPKTLVALPRAEVVGQLVTKLAKTVGLARSRAEAETMVSQGGYWQGETVQEEWLVDGEVLLMRAGKGKFVLVRTV